MTALADEITRAFSLEGRVAVVTGAASGIGRQAARTFAQAGARVVAADVDGERLAETVELVRGDGGRATACVTDVTRRTEVDALAAAALEPEGRLDVWANVAGVLRPGAIVDTTEDELDRSIAVNVKGVFWGCAAAARAMTPRRSGSIINIASAGADMAAPGIAAYAVTKAGVLMLTKTLAHEVGPHGVRANAVAPGFVDTPMVSHHFVRPDGTVDEEARSAIFGSRARQSPLRMTGEPTDIAYAMLYLAADASRFVTGQTLRPNGGVVMP